MPSAPALLHRLLRCLVLRMALMLGGVLEVRAAAMRARSRVMPEGKPRARLERELARIAGIRAALAAPSFWRDPRSAGKAAEVARCANDAGRRAMPRRIGGFAPGRGLRLAGRGTWRAAPVAPMPPWTRGRCMPALGCAIWTARAAGPQAALAHGR